jgi:D-alanyl-D-alanine carboxypeptidase (penicillin-binding protein 5/6)
MKFRQYPLKWTSLFLLGSLFLFFPGQNPYQIAQASWRSAPTQEMKIEVPPPASYPVNVTGVEAPFLSARSVLVMDQDSGVVMYEKNPHLRLLPASTVKIMTALVALEHYALDEVLVVPLVSDEGQDMELSAGEQMTVKNLLSGLLVASANDAALTLAQNYPGGEEAFVAAMNKKAEELNLVDSFFANPTGLDQAETLGKPPSYTTTLDLARLGMEALKNPVFAQLVATPKMVVTDTTGKIVHELFNINELVTYLEGVRGIKTGWTENAGECLVAYTEREGKGVITVVLGSNDRFGETKALIDWAFTNHQWQVLGSTQD